MSYLRSVVVFIILLGTLRVISVIIRGYLKLLLKFLRKKAYLILIILIVYPYILFKTYQYFSLVLYLPSALEVTWPVTMDETTHPIYFDCGIGIFKLSEHTLQQIKIKDINFFDGIREARGHNKSYIKYSPWQKTPIPRSWGIDEPYLICPTIGGKALNQFIAEAKQEGSFYTSTKNMELIVLPTSGIVIYSYNIPW